MCIGALQVECANILQNTYILKLHKSAIKEYQALYKKLNPASMYCALLLGVLDETGHMSQHLDVGAAAF